MEIFDIDTNGCGVINYWYPEDKEKRSIMTLIAVIKTKDHIVMAADKRGMYKIDGDMGFYTDTSKKLHIVHNYLVGISGQGEIGCAFLQKMKDNSTFVSIPINEFIEKAKTLFKESYNRMFENTEQKEKQVVNFIVAGFNNDKPLVYFLPSNKNFEEDLHDKPCLFNGPSHYAEYLIKKYYTDDNSSVELAERMAAYVITETASQYAYVGPSLSMIVSDSNNIAREKTKMEIDNIIIKNQKYDKKQKQSFQNIK